MVCILRVHVTIFSRIVEKFGRGGHERVPGVIVGCVCHQCNDVPFLVIADNQDGGPMNGMVR